MVRFRLRLDDLSSACFACSPLQETVLSLRMWTHPGHYPGQLPWFRRVCKAIPGLDPAQVRLLRSLIASNRWLPDFLTPRPAGPWPDIRDELTALRATPPDRVPLDLERAYLPHDRAVPEPLRHGLQVPERLLAEIADALENYWSSCLAPAWWPRARAVLEADIAHRARRLATGGADAAFADIDQRLRWDAGTLTIACERPRGAPADGVAISGRGLVLVPTLSHREPSPPSTPSSRRWSSIRRAGTGPWRTTARPRPPTGRWNACSAARGPGSFSSSTSPSPPRTWPAASMSPPRPSAST
ncbi:hypothetical protein [Streptomyces sp. NPDC048521]|uniref:hypothetical protein n=1 Tax=Streptomyces sp. NPDC048521 TaxID=3365566 RepID=UPI00371F2045